MSLVFFTLTGCGSLFIPQYDGSNQSNQGGAGLVIELPFSAGTEKLCTQGAGGTHSHTGISTRYDIDLDTNDYADEEVFASVTGVAYVHMESATSGFGYHVNIDLGDGTYVVIAHLSDIFISDGDEVSVGSLLGYEGKTGNATGEHVHIGLHQGDASLTADNGTSIPATYWTGNQSDGTEVTTISSEEFSCGIRSQGDPQDGDFYKSDLLINLWHPDGALVMTPDNARVYVLQDGKTRWIQNESTFWGLEYDFDDVTLVSESELDCYGDGSDIVGETFIDAAFDTEEELWLIVGAASDSNRYRARVRGTGWEDVLSSWGLSYDRSNEPDTYGDTSSYMTNWPPSASYVSMRDGTIVKESDASDVYIISGGFALPVKTWDVYLLMNHYRRDILTVDDGIVGELHQIGSCTTDQMCLDYEAVTTCGGGLELSDGPGEGGDLNQDDYDDPDEEQDDPADEVEQEQEESEEEVEQEEEEETSDVSTLTVEVDYPANSPELTLTVQPVYAISSLGDYWLVETSVTEDDEVSWSDEGDYSGLLGVRFNVDVDSDGDGTYDDWYCYGHYSSAFLEYGVAVDITLDSNSWDENDLVTWSPGSESDTNLGCSALLWFGNTTSISVGAVY
ncbi:M23 family metallopeptidase [Candidatus Uhrbacteria bacterium]|nr:M23 family metallopeptidase [Candidatus Uhrbacteria bacterium]